MAGRYDNVNGVWTKTNKRYANVNGIWTPAEKRFDNVNGVWTQSYSGGINVSAVKVGGHFPSGYYYYGDSKQWSASIDSNGMSFSFERTAINDTESHYMQILLSGMPTQESTSTDLVNFNGTINYTLTGALRGWTNIWLFTDRENDESNRIKLIGPTRSSGSQLINKTLTGTNPNMIPMSETSGGAGIISYDFGVRAYAYMFAGETFSFNCSLPWSAFTWVPKDQGLIYE